MEVRLAITCGIDWAETHHDVALVDESGKLVAKRRISDDAEGYRRLLELLADVGDTARTARTTIMDVPADQEHNGMPRHGTGAHSLWVGVLARVSGRCQPAPRSAIFKHCSRSSLLRVYLTPSPHRNATASLAFGGLSR